MKIWRTAKKLIRLSLWLALLALISCTFGYWKWVVHSPGEHLEKSAILQVISQESYIYYRDYDPLRPDDHKPIGSSSFVDESFHGH